MKNAKVNASTAKRAVRKAEKSMKASPKKQSGSKESSEKKEKTQEEVVEELRNGELNSRNYCSKTDLYNEIKDFQERLKKDPKAIMSDKLGIMIWQMAIKISGHSNFRNYPSNEKDEIVEAGIEKMVECVSKFDLDNPKKNPFGYLTTCTFNAMKAACKKYYRRINSERDIKQKFVTDGEASLGISPNNAFMRPENYPHDHDSSAN